MFALEWSGLDWPNSPKTRSTQGSPLWFKCLYIYTHLCFSWDMEDKHSKVQFAGHDKIIEGARSIQMSALWSGCGVAWTGQIQDPDFRSNVTYIHICNVVPWDMVINCHSRV